MARRLLIGVQSPYLGSVYGGGEKYLGVAVEALRERWPEHDLELLTPVPVDADAYRSRLNIDLEGIANRVATGRVTPVHRVANRLTALRPLRDLTLTRQAAAQTRRYDLLVAMVYRIRLRSAARATAVLCQFPYEVRSHAEVAGFAPVVAQSDYVRRQVRERWGLDAAIVAPPVDRPAAEPDWAAKEPSILSVGRFFTGGHSKRQDVLVRAFQRLCDTGLQGWRLQLAGAVHSDGPHAGYFEAVRELARGYPVDLHPNVDHEALQALYRKASLYWHAAGYGVDAGADPEALEHFGITIVEAMAAGAVPLAHGRGGPAEIVASGVDGVLWDEPEQLVEATRELAADPARRRTLGERARAASARFDRSRFKADITAVLEPAVRALEGA